MKGERKEENGRNTCQEMVDKIGYLKLKKDRGMEGGKSDRGLKM